MKDQTEFLEPGKLAVQLLSERAIKKNIVIDWNFMTIENSGSTIRKRTQVGKRCAKSSHALKECGVCLSRCPVIVHHMKDIKNLLNPDKPDIFRIMFSGRTFLGLRKENS